MNNKNTNCTGQTYIKHLLKRLVYGTPIRCGAPSHNHQSIPEYPIVYERQAKANTITHHKEVKETIV